MQTRACPCTGTSTHRVPKWVLKIACDLVEQRKRKHREEREQAGHDRICNTRSEADSTAKM